jgi:MFS family permease
MTRARRDSGEPTSPRGVLVLVRILLLFESSLYSAVTPVLPHYARELGASKPAIGVLAAAYAAGLIPGGLLGGWLAKRVGVRRTTLTGLVAFAVWVAAFGFATDIVTLDVLRALQGVASGCIWGGALTWVIAASPRERRGHVIGSAIGAATFGTLLGPLLGTFAAAVGTGPAFAVVGAISLALAGWVLRYPDPPRAEARPHTPITELLGSRTFVLGVWLVALEAITLGATNTLIPLRLSRLGASGVAIGATFLAAAGVSTLLAPLVGRVTDRRGPFRPMLAGLAVSALLMAALPLPDSALSLAVLSVITLGAPLTAYLIPAASLITEAAERTGVELAVATMTLNIAYAVGETVGAPAGASISQATSDAVPLLLIAALMALTLPAAAAVWRRQRAEPPTTGGPGAAGGAERPDIEPSRPELQAVDLG